MRTVWVGVWLLGASVGCGDQELAVESEAWAVDAGAQAGPPLPPLLSLDLSRAIDPGGVLSVEIRGATPNAQVFLVLSDGGFGRGGCPAVLQGYCLSIEPGSGYRRISLVTNGRGVARADVPVPDVLGPGAWWMQAVDPTAAIGSGVERLEVLAPDCDLVDTAVVCGPADTAVVDTAVAAPVEHVEAFELSANFGYDPAVDAAVPVAALGASVPMFLFRVGSTAGVLGTSDHYCDVTLTAAGPIPRAGWAPLGGRHLFGVDFDATRHTLAIQSCGPNVDMAEVSAFVTDVVQCGPWGVAIDAVTQPRTANLLAGWGIAATDATGATFVFDPQCGMPAPTNEGFALLYNLPLVGPAPAVVDYVGGLLRFTTGPGGVLLPAAGYWRAFESSYYRL
jgi:hypothetical protein